MATVYIPLNKPMTDAEVVAAILQAAQSAGNVGGLPDVPATVSKPGSEEAEFEKLSVNVIDPDQQLGT